MEEVESLFDEELLKDPKVRTELVNTLRIFKDTGMMPSPYLQYYWFTDEIIEHQMKTGITRAQEVIEMENKFLQAITSRYKKINGLKCKEAASGTQT